MMESGVTFDCAQFVADNEFARMVKHAIAGIPVTDETLMVEDIHQIGSAGDFLSLDSTYRLMRDQSRAGLLDRRVREDWEARGSTDMYERARIEALEIMESHRPEPLDDASKRRIRQIVAKSDRDLAGVSPREGDAW
jgi:trimethylamine--corrinoid protein Co-methyltransferase